MEIVAKFYPHLWSWELIDQLVITSEVNIKQDIKAFGEAEFLMPIVPWIKEDCKVELYEANSNEDRLIFRGFIYEINPVWWQFQTIKITARGEKAILHKRKALQDYKFANQSISAIVTELLQKYNTEYHEDWGFELQKDENLTLEIGLGDDYYDVFDEICEQKELFWEVEDWVISFKKSGNDLRAMQILEFDGFSPNPWNITNIELIGTATGGNVVLVEDSNGKKTIDKSQFSGFLTGVVTKQIRKGDDAEKAKQFAKEQARPQRKYQIQVANGSIEAKVWDKIKVEVVNTNSFYDYQWDAMVQSKVTTYVNASKVVQYGIEEFMVKPFNWETWVEAVEKSIKLLRQRKGDGETAPAPSVDLSWYATSSAVNQALQSQNTKIDQKADSTFVQWVAQTAQTALNAANQAQQTANSKADAHHNHDGRYYTEAEIDEKLRGKADADHTHEFPSAPIIVTVDTAPKTAAKIGSTTAGNYQPKLGDELIVIFRNWTFVQTATLDIDGSWAKNIKLWNANVGTGVLNLGDKENSNIPIKMRYDGQAYMLFWPTHNSQYGELPEDEIRNPSANATRSITGRRVAKMKEYFEQNVPTPTQDAHAANKAYVDAELSKLPASSWGADPTAVHLSWEEEITGHKRFKGWLSMRGTDWQYWRWETLQLRKWAWSERRVMNGRSDYDWGLLFEYLNDGYLNNVLIRRKWGLHFSYFTNNAELKRRFKLGTRSDHSGIDHGAGGHILQFLWWDLSSDPEWSGHDWGRGIEFWPHGNPYLKMQGDDTHIGRSGGRVLIGGRERNGSGLEVVPINKTITGRASWSRTAPGNWFLEYRYKAYSDRLRMNGEVMYDGYVGNRSLPLRYRFCKQWEEIKIEGLENMVHFEFIRFIKIG